MTFYGDYSAYINLATGENQFEDYGSYWYVSEYDGKLYIYINEEYFGFDYHHYGSGLVLIDEDGYYYDFTLYE